jgi:hypothetical protein
LFRSLLCPQVISPGEVEIWEGFVTFAFFPLMVLNAYIVDKKPCTAVPYKKVHRGVVCNSTVALPCVRLIVRSHSSSSKGVKATHATAS